MDREGVRGLKMKIPPTIGETEEMNLRPTVVARSWLSAVPLDLHWSRCMHVVEQVGMKVSGWLGHAWVLSSRKQSAGLSPLLLVVDRR